MAGPRPDDPYSPTLDVSPEVQMPFDTASVRASPQDMGANLGAGISNFGKGAEEASDNLMKVEMAHLGIANEHAANMAELDLSVRGGELYDKYKSLEGMDAANAKDHYVQEYLKLNQQIKSGLPSSDAQRAYDTATVRRMALTIQNMNSYAADSRKSAYKTGRLSMLKNTTDQALGYDIASSDKELGSIEGDITHSVNDLFTNPDYGSQRTISATMDPKTGRLQYDTSTTDGQLAQASYDNYLHTQLSQMYANATDALYNDPKHGNAKAASDFLDRHQDDMGRQAYQSLRNKLASGLKNFETKDTVNSVFNQEMGRYNNPSNSFDYKSAPGMVNPGNLDPYNRPVLDNKDGTFSTTSSISIGTDKGEVLIPTVVDGKRLSNDDAIAHYKKTGENFGTFKTPEDADKFATSLHNSQAADPHFLVETFIQQETSGGKTDPTNIGQIQPDTWKQFAKPGEVISNPIDNRAVTKRMLDKYSKDYNGDVSRVAVAFFSGPGNVAPEGSDTPYKRDYTDKNGKLVSSYVSDIQNRTGAQPTQTYRTQSDYVLAKWDDIMKATDDESESRHPGDLDFAERNRRQMTTQLNNIVQDQKRQNIVNSHNVIDYIDKNHVTDISQLEGAPTQVKHAYEDLTSADSQYYNSLQKLIAGKSFNRMPGYGPAFYQNFTKMANGLVGNSLDFSNEVNMEEGKNSPLTNHGNDVLSQTFKRYTDPQGKLTPDGAAFLKAEQSYLSNERKRRVGSWTGDYDTNENFDKFLTEAVPQIETRVQAGQKEGKSLQQISAELFSPKINGKDNPDAVRTNVTPPDPMTLVKQRQNGFAFGGKTGTQAPPLKPDDVKTYDDLKKYAVQTKMSKDDYIKMAREKGFAPPAVPAP